MAPSKYFALLFYWGALFPALLPAQDQGSTAADSAFYASLDTLPADLSEMSQGLIGEWKERKGRGYLVVKPGYLEHTDKKGITIRGNWYIKKTKIGYAIYVLDEAGDLIKSFPIADRNDITSWSVDMGLRKYLKQ